MLGPYTHRIDPILLDVGGVHLWWYGLGFALGFLELHLFLRRGGGQLRLSPREVWSLSLYMTIGVLVGGRALEIAFDEWPFYREHLRLLPAWWLGGMATHGLLLGGALGAALFARRYGKPFLLVADALVIPAAFLMGMGRIGNFIDGQIVGAVTDVPWAVEFPYAEGFRHPVVLYDGAKNLLLMAWLLHVRRVNPTPGALAACFVFWYAFPRFFIDLFREYPTHRLVLGTGQTLNIVMAVIGAAALYRSRLRRLGRLKGSAGVGARRCAGGGPAGERAAAPVAAPRLRGPAGVLPDDSEQLDAGHPGPLRGSASGPGALLAVSRDRHRAALLACGARWDGHRAADRERGTGEMISRQPSCAVVILGLIAAPASAADEPAAPEVLRAAEAVELAAVARAARQSAAPEAVPAVPGATAPAAVAGAASQAAAPETVREPESGVTFPVALTPPASGTPHWLMGTGIRQRTIFRVNVYAFGLYVDAGGARASLSEFAGATAEALGRDERFTRRLLDLDFGMALRLVMTRTVSGGDVADAFDDALRPRMRRAGRGADGDAAAAGPGDAARPPRRGRRAARCRDRLLVRSRRPPRHDGGRRRAAAHRVAGPLPRPVRRLPGRGPDRAPTAGAT